MLKYWDWPEVLILGADQKDRGLWERECKSPGFSKSQLIISFPGTSPRSIADDPGEEIGAELANFSCLS